MTDLCLNNGTKLLFRHGDDERIFDMCRDNIEDGTFGSFSSLYVRFSAKEMVNMGFKVVFYIPEGEAVTESLDGK